MYNSFWVSTPSTSEVLQMAEHRTEATKWLNYLRNGTGQHDIFIGYLRRALKAGGLTPENIGTSDAEIETLRVKSCKNAATKWLNHLHNGSDQYEVSIGYLRWELEAGGLTTENIGTSDAEIEALRIKGCKNAATKWLNHLRSGTYQYDSIISDLRRELKAGGLTPESIGTSDAEIEALRIKGCKKAATKWLNYLRNGTFHCDSFIEYLRKELEAGGLTPENIGTSDAEINGFKKGHLTQL